MQKKSLNLNDSLSSEKGIGNFLSKILQDEKSGRYTPSPSDITEGEPVYNSVLDQVNAARESALDMRKRFDSIDIGDDPQSAAKLKVELKRLQDESNRFRRVVEAPDEKPSFWRYLFHPWSYRPNREQVTSDALVERRLRASDIRDDLNLINSQAGILHDIASDVDIDTNFELKSFGTKASLRDSVEDIKEYLDIIVGTLSKTSRDLTQARKSTKTMKKLDTIKTNDHEEKATVDAALKYYKAMKDTMQDIVVTKPSSKLFGIGGNKDPEPDEMSEAALNVLMEGSNQANDLSLEQATNLNGADYENLGQTFDEVANRAEALMHSLPDDASQLTQQPVNIADQLNKEMNNLNRLNQNYDRTGQVDPYSIDESQQVVDESQDVFNDFGDLEDFVSTPVGGDAYGSYRSVSTKKIDLKKKKQQLAALIVKLRKAAQKFKKKKQAAEIVKKQAVQAKAILSKKNSR